jgi:4a-hydroxytetrahydrobiopterin dehydratase
LHAHEIARLRSDLPGWEVVSVSGRQQLVRSFTFPDFMSAVQFVTRIATVAEQEGHHPDLEVGWGRVQVKLWTHAAGGLTENDFILAAKIDRLAGEPSVESPSGPDRS